MKVSNNLLEIGLISSNDTVTAIVSPVLSNQHCFLLSDGTQLKVPPEPKVANVGMLNKHGTMVTLALQSAFVSPRTKALSR